MSRRPRLVLAMTAAAAICGTAVLIVRGPLFAIIYAAWALAVIASGAILESAHR